MPSSTKARLMCFVAAVVYPMFGIPLILLGAGAASTGNHDVPDVGDGVSDLNFVPTVGIFWN